MAMDQSAVAGTTPQVVCVRPGL